MQHVWPPVLAILFVCRLPDTLWAQNSDEPTMWEFKETQSEFKVKGCGTDNTRWPCFPFEPKLSLIINRSQCYSKKHNQGILSYSSYFCYFFPVISKPFTLQNAYKKR